MVARLTNFELDTVRFSLAAGVERFTDLVLPALRAQPGFEGVYVLVNPDGRGLVMTMWASEHDADEGLRSGFWSTQVEKFVTVFRSPAGRESYDVVIAEAPALATG